LEDSLGSKRLHGVNVVTAKAKVACDKPT